MEYIIGVLTILLLIPLLMGAYLIVMDSQYEWYRKKLSYDKKGCNNNYMCHNRRMLSNKLKGDNMNNNKEFNKFVEAYNNTVEKPLQVSEAHSFMNSPRSLSHMAILRDEQGIDIALVTGARGVVKVKAIWRT